MASCTSGFFPKHQWGKWAKKETQNQSKYEESMDEDMKYPAYQERACELCGEIQQKPLDYA